MGAFDHHFQELGYIDLSESSLKFTSITADAETPLDTVGKSEACTVRIVFGGTRTMQARAIIAEIAREVRL